MSLSYVGVFYTGASESLVRQRSHRSFEVISTPRRHTGLRKKIHWKELNSGSVDCIAKR